MSSPSEADGLPLGVNCEWCRDPERPATVRVPILKKVKGAKGMHDTGMGMYACSEHEQIAKETARNRG